ncbi:hypothetical protein [Seonamhaeicola marinus]|uniref:PQQ-binding-like beta-propeller repeat protein n=1 Tax=Seonamhaeicola marinus TaxID=1912246 RepID=A0A5D0HKD8_9FLAO|nr:hypothetical protein [Seonamhaeicola marinus]TYA71725.1 hypothetical protein FUA24_19405 [Seonamhaeicola marinus]
MNKLNYITVLSFLLIFNSTVWGIQDPNPIKSINTGYTILKVRIADKEKTSAYLVGSSYEGTIVAYSYKGELLWENKLSGYMNHDVWCGDIDNDGKDEIVTANADGTIYCLNFKGELLWKFKENAAPMYAVSIIKHSNECYVVAGGFDKNIYYLSKDGKLIKRIHSNSFSIEKPRSKYRKDIPKPNECTANFIRTIKMKDGSQNLVVLGTNNHMNVPGTLYFFKPLEDKPFKTVKIQASSDIKKKIRIRPLGDFKTADIDNDGNEDIILGSSSHVNDILVTTYNLKTDRFDFNRITKVKFGYDIAHNATLKTEKGIKYLTRVGSQIHIYNPKKVNDTERIVSKYAYNDMVKDTKRDMLILGSAQSGGSCIHIINLQNSNWKPAFKALRPKGKIQEIIENTKITRYNLKKYKKPTYQNNSQPVFFMTEKVPESQLSLKHKIDKTYGNPIFLNSLHMKNVEDFDRSVLSNDKYRKTRDRRKKYTLSQKEAVNQITNQYEGEPGVAYWAGHGNDPFMFNINTTKKILDKANGKKTVLIYPEVEDHNKENLDFLVGELLYPLAEYAQNRNANIFLRSKNIFWLGSNYLSSWSELMSGKYADVFVPSMEETTDKSMELSLAGRMGMWTSGAVNGWGTRAVPDNVSFDRSRQLGYQRLPNHFLRMLIFHTANGAQYINNFAVDQEYLSIYWELIAKGALYVPKRNEILSISPVHISMKKPDHHFLNDGANVKWTTFYDEAFESKHKYVFSRLNGTWPGAPITDWDFSKYAAGVNERRLNFLAPYEYGMVLITPPQSGVYAEKNAPRGKLTEHLHPLYKSIMKEYITDGHNYYSNDGSTTYKADIYYKTIQDDLKESSKKLPITVSGDVAWVVAQIGPKQLRLTLVENGYINPKKATAKVRFNSINPLSIKDILNGEQFMIKNDDTLEIEIPLGGFRFIDIELKSSL